MTDLGRVSLLPNEDSVWCCNPAPQIAHNEASGVTDTVYTHSYIQDQQYTMYSTENTAVGVHTNQTLYVDVAPVF